MTILLWYTHVVLCGVGLLCKQKNTCELAVSEFPRTPHQVLNGLVSLTKGEGHVRIDKILTVDGLKSEYCQS